MHIEISIQVKAQYIDEQSRPENNQHVFAYTVRIENNSCDTVQLLSRYWYIQDSENRIQEAKGEGVIGEQPTLAPGESFTYTSGAVIHTPPGTMKGHYRFKKKDGEEFDQEIPMFALILPGSLH